jgi:hypothetical protein
MVVDGITYSKRLDAGQRLKQLLERELTGLTASGHQPTKTQTGHLGGFDVTAATQRLTGTTQVAIVLDLEGVPGAELRMTAEDLADTEPSRLIIRLENRLSGLDVLKTKTLDEIARLDKEAARASEDISKACPQTDQLVAARDHARQIEEQLEEAARSRERYEHHESAEAATPGTTDLADVHRAARDHISAGELNHAEAPGMAVVVNGIPRGTTAEPTIRSRIASGGTGHQQSAEAVRITQYGFPERNPLADPRNLGAATGRSRPHSPTQATHGGLKPGPGR